MIVGEHSHPYLHQYIHSGGAPRVLLAEDDDELRRAVGETLRGEGYQVLEASDGSEILAMFSSVSKKALPAPDVIVMDIRMPRHSGLDLLLALKLSEWGLPVVLMTGFPDERTRAFAEEYGAFAILEKPLRVEDLTTAVKAALAPA